MFVVFFLYVWMFVGMMVWEYLMANDEFVELKDIIFVEFT